MRLPLYDGKLDLLAVARSFNLDPARLSVSVILGTEEAEDDLEAPVEFHYISIDFRTGLSRLTWDELHEEVSHVYGFPLPDGKTLATSLVFDGPPFPLSGSLPTWLSNLSAAVATAHRAVVDVESVICHKFLVRFRKCFGVAELQSVPNDRTLLDMCLDEPYPEAYIDHHLPPTEPLPPLFDHCRLPESYHWLQPEDIAKQKLMFQIKTFNLDVEVRSRSSAVLTYSTGDAVLGIDLVSEMGQLGFLRCEVDFYLWESLSSLPHLQLITDLKTGGVVFYLKEYDAVIAREAMSMDSLRAFLVAFFATLPPDAASRPAWSVLKRTKRRGRWSSKVLDVFSSDPGTSD